MPGSDATPTDPLERLFSTLVENLAALDPDALRHPVPVADVHERIVPYRTHRATLGVDSSEDYEMAVMRLLSGEGGFAETFPADAREAIAAEVEGVNPDTGLFRQFPEATLLLAPDRVAAVLGSEPREEPAQSFRDAGAAAQFASPDEDEDEVAEKEAPRTGAEGEERPPFMLEEGDDDALRPVARPREMTGSAPCPYCGAALPVGRTVLFCPHCGQNIGVVHCPTCGTELDVGWQFCITCGQKATGLG